MTIWLADITAAVDSAGATTVLRVATDSYCSARSDSPSDTAWLPYIRDPGNVEQRLFGRSQTSGASTIGVGVLELVNADGSLDYLMDCGFDGRPLTIRAVEPGAPLSSAVTVLEAIMEQAEFTRAGITIRVRDRLAALDVQLAAATYVGDNALPSGIEGVSGDLKGKPKPRLYGRSLNIAPPCVNTSRLVYQLHDGAITSIEAVYDRGAALTAGAAYASRADMEATAPAAGQYRAWLGGGCIRLGSAPTGLVTADATRGATLADRCVAQLLRTIALDADPSLTVSAADVAALAAAAPGEVGVWVDGTDTALSVMDRIAASVGAWYGPDAVGVLRMGRVAAPSGSPALALGDVEIVSLERQASRDTANGLPAYRVTLQYKRFHRTLDASDVAGVVAADRRAELEREYRTVVASDAAVRAKHLLAGDIERTTLLLSAADAAAEAARLLALYGAERLTLQVEARLTPAQMAALSLGAVVRVVHPRFGLAAGRNLLLIGLVRELESSRATLTLWG